MLKNPFIVYVIAFSSVIFAYQWNWSGIYPELSLGLVSFFIVTFLSSFLLAIFISKSIRKKSEYVGGYLSRHVFIFLLVGFVVDIAYQGGIPLKLLIDGNDYNYIEFGIPTLHVAIVTFGGVFSVVRFADYLYTKNYRFLIQAAVPLVYDILIVNRGAALMVMISWIFVIVIKRGELGVKKGLIYVMLLLSTLYLFGVLGDLRSGEGGIEEIGVPSISFANSGAPKAYFWAYIYLTSPVANLQKTVNKIPDTSLGFTEFLFSELTPDFISKRVMPILGSEARIKTSQIDAALNVSTIYARSYVYLGWIGMMCMFLALVVVIVVYIKLINRSVCRVPALALLNTMIVFCIFDNMIAFSGMILQLIWILFLPNFQRRHLR